VAVVEKPEPASLSVYSFPEGADVRVDGKLLAKTPCRIDKIPVRASAEVVVTHEGYKPYRQKIALTAGKAVSLTAQLKPLETVLEIATVPAGATVTVNGRDLGISPVRLPDAEAGTYEIRAELAGYDAAEQTVTLAQYEERKETVMLVKNLGTVSLSTMVTGVTVTVDGSVVGVTSADGSGRPTATIDALQPGEHEVTLSKPGHVSKTYTVKIAKGQTLSLDCELEPVLTADYEVVTIDGTTYRGRLLRITPDGTVRIEVGPGRYRNIPANVIATSREL
jgi:hypothetical protein